MEMSSLGTDASQEIEWTPEMDLVSAVARLDLSSAHDGSAYETAVGKIQTWLLSFSHQMSHMDPFTQKLLERTKASRSKLEAKLCNTPQPLPRKRRSPLREDFLPEIINSILNEQKYDNLSEDNSPEKRQCFEQQEEVENIREAKENRIKSPEKRNKSPEKRNKSYADQGEYNDSVLTTKIKTSGRIPLDDCGDIVQKRSNRLARLAAEINSWEDDLKDDSVPKLPVPREVKPEPPVAQSRSITVNNSPVNENRSIPINKTPVKENRSIPIPSSRTSSSPRKSRVIEPETPKSAVRVSKSPSKPDDISENARSLQACPPQATPRRRSSSFAGSSLSSPARPIISKKQSFSAEKPKRTTKTIVWDQAVVATLEAQGFTKSPSKSKLEYKFNRNAGSPKNKIISKESESESSEDERASDSSSSSNSSEDVQMSPKAAIKQSPFKRAETERVSVRQLAEKFAVPFAASTPQRDPAQLPLSARVALFEKEARVQSKNAAATAFKKPLGDGNKNFVKHQLPTKLSPQKANSAVKENEKKVEESKVKVSPTKPVGAHTFQLHRKLFEHGKDWKENEISLRIKEDREKDMEVVLNRWSYKNKQAAESAALSATQQRVGVQQQQPKAEPKKPVYNAPVVKKEIPPPPPLPIQPLVLPIGSQNNCYKDRNIYDDDSLTETESDDEGLEELEPSMDSEEELNRALAVVDAICTDDDTETDMDSSILKAFKQIDNENERIVEKEKSPLVNVTFKMPSNDRVFATQKRYDESSEEKSDEEQQLVHTISFYRRQNEMSRYTVTRKIIRNENQSSATTSDSTSNDDDDYYQSDEIQQSFQEKVKHLQEEINSQQDVMRQASHALVVCRSNELFQGSVEQIEGERLLLVSAQKRQACVNEIEKLKTDGALGIAGSIRKRSKGSLSIGDMKLVLKKEFLEQTAHGKSGDFVHFFICVIKHRAQAIATQMSSTMDGVSSGALHFPNLINIRDLDRDFNVIVEVYGLQTKRECVNREHKTLSKKDKSKLTLTPKKRQSKKDLKMLYPKIQSPGGPNVICTSSFALIGFTALNLMTMNKKSWNLEKVPFVSPLEGNLIMKVRCFSDFKTEEQGFLTMFDDVAGYGNWYRRWFVLTDKVLSYWKYPDDVKQKAPIGQIDLCQCITSDVSLVARDICARPHTFMLIIVRPPSKETTDSLIVHNFKSYATIKVLLSADTKEERISWCQYMNRTLENLRTWDPQALKPMPDDFELQNQL